jgi:hypothetical protein
LARDDWLIYAGWADLILATDEIITRESGYSRQGEKKGRRRVERKEERGKREQEKREEKKKDGDDIMELID